MADTRILLQRLEKYHASVTKHIEALDHEFSRLKQRWGRLRQHYRGDSAEEFGPVWEGTSQMFREYSDHARAIAAILAKRIEKLRDLNRREGTLS